VTILFSVFAGSITDPLLNECLQVSRDEDSFVSFISGRFKNVDSDLGRRIIRIVERTYHFKYEVRELAERQLHAPITIFKARGDDHSFIENGSGYSSKATTVVNLDADHYSLLKNPFIGELVTLIRYHRRDE